jgi:hypothetical protein
MAPRDPGAAQASSGQGGAGELSLGAGARELGMVQASSALGQRSRAPARARRGAGAHELGAAQASSPSGRRKRVLARAASASSGQGTRSSGRAPARGGLRAVGDGGEGLVGVDQMRANLGTLL